jgi:hypothetical protein
MFPPLVAWSNVMADMAVVLIVAKMEPGLVSFLQPVKITNTAARQHKFRMAGLF